MGPGRTARVLLVGALVLLGLGTSAGASVVTAVPAAARVTTVSASGTAALHLRVPRASDIDLDHTRLIPGRRTSRVSVLLIPDVQRCDAGIPVCTFTLLTWVRGWSPNVGTQQEGDPQRSFSAIASPATVFPGMSTLYVVSDGPVTVVWQFPQLSGTTRLSATVPLRARAGSLRDVCAQACQVAPFSRTRYGGVTVSSSVPSFVYGLAWVQKPAVWTAGTGHTATMEALTCMATDAQERSVSTSAADYSQGCLTTPRDTMGGSDQFGTRKVATDVPDCIRPDVIGESCQIFEPRVAKRAYVGFRTSFVDPLAAVPGEPQITTGAYFLQIPYLKGYQH